MLGKLKLSLYDFQNTFDNQKMLVQFLDHSNLITAFLAIWRLAPRGRKVGTAAAKEDPKEEPDAARGDPSKTPGDRKRTRGEPTEVFPESRPFPKKRRAEAEPTKTESAEAWRDEKAIKPE